jgi:hypothetical protein
MEQFPGNDEPSKDVASSPNYEHVTKKPRLESQDESAGDAEISEHMKTWVQSLNDPAAPQSAQQDAPQATSGNDDRRPYHDEVMDLLGEKAGVSSDGSVASMGYDDDVKNEIVVPRRQRDSSPRRNVSNPFLKSTTKLLESVTDLASVLSHDDCMLLGRYFWVFTLEQLDFLLSDSEDYSFIDEKQVKTARQEFTDRLRKLLLGERPGQKSGYNRSEENFRLGIDPEAIAAAALCGEDVHDEGLRKDIRANVSSKSFPWLDSGTTPTTAMGPEDSKMPGLAQENMYAPQVVDGNPMQSLDHHSGGYDAIPVASGTNDTLMCAEDMALKDTTDPELLPDAEDEGNHNGSDLISESAKQEEPVKIEDTLTKWRAAIREYKDNGLAIADSKKFKIDGAIGVLVPVSTMNFLRSVETVFVWDFLAARRQVRRYW